MVALVWARCICHVAEEFAGYHCGSCFKKAKFRLKLPPHHHCVKRDVTKTKKIRTVLLPLAQITIRKLDVSCTVAICLRIIWKAPSSPKGRSRLCPAASLRWWPAAPKHEEPLQQHHHARAKQKLNHVATRLGHFCSKRDKTIFQKTCNWSEFCKFRIEETKTLPTADNHVADSIGWRCSPSVCLPRRFVGTQIPSEKRCAPRYPRGAFRSPTKCGWKRSPSDGARTMWKGRARACRSWCRTRQRTSSWCIQGT